VLKLRHRPMCAARIVSGVRRRFDDVVEQFPGGPRA
jgi:hypothetical protein